MLMSDLKAKFKDIFQTDAEPRIFFAPGRINLIGEHTDYNGGHVFPASLSFGTYALAIPRDDAKLRFYSMNFSESGIIESSLSELAYDKAHGWANYPKGMFHYLIESGCQIQYGADILFYGEIPNGAGLSSSASIELATGVMVNSLYSLDLDQLELVKLGKKVENDYIGVNSGIMDQFAIGMGKQDHAILLDCSTLKYEYAPIALKEYDIVIINTNKQRTLAGSKYNERRAECEAALSDLQKELNVASLGELTPAQFDEHRHLIADETHQKRAKHSVYENARTLEALAKLKAGDIEGFGQLMNQSHISLRDDYEVTGLELDTIVEAAWEQEGVLGARMTGAGFGGCAIAIVEKPAADAFKDGVNAVYRNKIGYDATFYTASIGSGARELKEELEA